MKISNLKDATSKSISQFVGLCLYLFGTIFIGIFPDKAREILGDKILATYNYFSGWGWALIGIGIFFAFFVFNYISASKNRMPEKKEILTGNANIQTSRITVSQSGENNIGQQSAGTINNYFDKANGTGINEKESKDRKEKIVFHRMYYHEELVVEGSTPEQLMMYIRENISSSFWFIHVNNNTVAYDVNPEKTKFYYPNIDNVDTYGIIFCGIKHDLEKREGGILNRRNGVSIPNMFTISILAAGLGDKTKLHVRYDTQIKELLELFDKFEKTLIDSRIFDIRSNKPQIFI